MQVFKKILFSFCILLSSIILSDAQVFKGEIIGGFNLTQVDGDQEIGYKKIGVHAGIGVMFPFSFKGNQENKPWAVSMEILFNQRGSRARNLNYNPQDTINNYTQGKFRYLLRLNYVSLPVIIHFTDKDKWTVGVGFAYNRMFSSKEWEYDVLQTYDSVKRLNPNDFTVLADVRFRIWQQLKFGFRFEYSMFSLRSRFFPYTSKTPEEKRKQYNNSLTFYLVFMLNEKRVERTKQKQKIEKPYYY
ncbi:MAG: PorT family protein [Bacteroidales bacterium]|jgi:hypothetical protein|nr:PorT family protein [Bacteroidales bacterium]